MYIRDYTMCLLRQAYHCQLVGVMNLDPPYPQGNLGLFASAANCQ